MWACALGMFKNKRRYDMRGTQENATISMHRCSGAGTYIQIRVTREKVSDIIAQVNLSPEEFGNCVTGLSCVPCVSVTTRSKE